MVTTLGEKEVCSYWIAVGEAVERLVRLPANDVWQASLTMLSTFQPFFRRAFETYIRTIWLPLQEKAAYNPLEDNLEEKVQSKELLKVDFSTDDSCDDEEED